MRNAAASSLASFVYVLVASGGTFIIRGEHGGVLSREPMNDGCPDVCNKSVEETKRVQPLKLIAAASRCTMSHGSNVAESSIQLFQAARTHGFSMALK